MDKELLKKDYFIHINNLNHVYDKCMSSATTFLAFE